jgi:hypothetical protein
LTYNYLYGAFTKLILDPDDDLPEFEHLFTVENTVKLGIHQCVIINGMLLYFDLNDEAGSGNTISEAGKDRAYLFTNQIEFNKVELNTARVYRPYGRLLDGYVALESVVPRGKDFNTVSVSTTAVTKDDTFAKAFVGADNVRVTKNEGQGQGMQYSISLYQQTEVLKEYEFLKIRHRLYRNNLVTDLVGIGIESRGITYNLPYWGVSFILSNRDYVSNKFQRRRGDALMLNRDVKTRNSWFLTTTPPERAEQRTSTPTRFQTMYRFGNSFINNVWHNTNPDNPGELLYYNKVLG